MLNKSIISLWISSGQIFEKLDVDKNLIQNIKNIRQYEHYQEGSPHPFHA